MSESSVEREPAAGGGEPTSSDGKLAVRLNEDRGRNSPPALFDEFSEELTELGIAPDRISQILYRIYVKAYEGFLADERMRCR